MRESLLETLKNLHEQLADESSLDAEQISMLRRAVAEIEETLDRSDVNSLALANRLKADSVGFVDSHPLLVQTIGRIADLLSQMGI